MKISPEYAAAILPVAGTPVARGATGAGGADFASGLSKALDSLGSMQEQADKLVSQAVAGKTDDLHQVVLAVERANVALQMGMSVRNKVVEAYQEIIHMQV